MKKWLFAMFNMYEQITRHWVSVLMYTSLGLKSFTQLSFLAKHDQVDDECGWTICKVYFLTTIKYIVYLHIQDIIHKCFGRSKNNSPWLEH